MQNFVQHPGFFEFFGELPLFFRLFIGLVVTLVGGTFLYVIIKGVTTWASNNAAAVVTRYAKAVDKRTAVWGGSGDSAANTSYFVTFEYEDGSRMELQVRPQQYGVIVAGDDGELTHQGTRFKQFRRYAAGSTV